MWGAFVILIRIWFGIVVSSLDNSRDIQSDMSQIRSELSEFMDRGKTADMLAYLERIESKYNTLLVDNYMPSLYTFKGVGLYNMLKPEEAIIAFETGLRHFPNEVRAWVNLGEVQVQLFQLKEAIHSFQMAKELGDTASVLRLMRCMTWSGNYADFDIVLAEIESIGNDCMRNITSCSFDSNGGLEYSDVPGYLHNLLSQKIPNSHDNLYKLDPMSFPPLWKSPPFTTPIRRMKIGLISSDFGVHPVSSLIRGFIQMVNKTEVELFCFSVNPRSSWWGDNITAEVEHFVSLAHLNTYTAAERIISYQIEVLIDLNGHTMFSGLPILSHRPAPVQISYLGLPLTTGAKFMDYFVGDRVALPAEHASHFTEKLLILPHCYILNDYAQVQGGVLDYTIVSSADQRASREFLNFSSIIYQKQLTPVSFLTSRRLKAPAYPYAIEPNALFERIRDISRTSLIFATLSNSQKIDPVIFEVWMNILNRYPSSVLLFMEYAGATEYYRNFQRLGMYYGINSHRILLVSQTPWIDHFHAKTPIDLIFDTSNKNGHTTGLDGIWCGIPTVSLAGGLMMPARAGESFAASLGSEIGLVYSLKEYEDLVTRIVDSYYSYKSKGAGSKDLLSNWRRYVSDKRITSSLFDTLQSTRQFTRLLQTTWEVEHLIPLLSKSFLPKKATLYLGHEVTLSLKPFHVILTENVKVYGDPNIRNVSVSQIYGESSQVFAEETKGQLLRRKTSRMLALERQRAPLPVSSGAAPLQQEAHQAASLKSPADNYTAIPDYVFDGRLIMLNIGGMMEAQGWLIVNSQGASYGRDYRVDIERDMGDLHGLVNNSVSAIYSSHTLEHNSFGDGALTKTLAEWFRVIRPGGIVMISVPDLETLARMLLDKSANMDLSARWMTIKMIYGAQFDSFDYHKVGFNEEMLRYFLEQSGFCQIERLKNFNLNIKDTSDYIYKGYFISLNMVAKVCPSSKLDIEYDGFEIGHSGTPY